MVSCTSYTNNINRNSFRWPVNEDILGYTSDESLCHLTSPLPLNWRGKYKLLDGDFVMESQLITGWWTLIRCFMKLYNRSKSICVIKINMMSGTNNGNLIMESSNNLFLLLANNPNKAKRLFEAFIITFPLLVPFYKMMLSISPMQKIKSVTFKLTDKICVTQKIELEY